MGKTLLENSWRQKPLEVLKSCNIQFSDSKKFVVRFRFYWRPPEGFYFHWRGFKKAFYNLKLYAG